MLEPPSNGVNVRMGAAVSQMPCETWKISKLLLSTFPSNGNGIRRSVGRAAEEGGQLAVQILDFERGGRAPGTLIADVDGDDLGIGVVGNEQHVVWPEGDRPDRRDAGLAEAECGIHREPPTATLPS